MSDSWVLSIVVILAGGKAKFIAETFCEIRGVAEPDFKCYFRDVAGMCCKKLCCPVQSGSLDQF